MKHPPDGIRGIGSLARHLGEVLIDETVEPGEDLLVLGWRCRKLEEGLVGFEVVDDGDQVLVPLGHAMEGMEVASLEGFLLLTRRSKTRCQ